MNQIKSATNSVRPTCDVTYWGMLIKAVLRIPTWGRLFYMPPRRRSAFRSKRPQDTRGLRLESLETRSLLNAAPLALSHTGLAVSSDLATAADLIANPIPRVDITQGTTQVVSLQGDFQAADGSSPGCRFQVLADS